jgi:hypothetical protein
MTMDAPISQPIVAYVAMGANMQYTPPMASSTPKMIVITFIVLLSVSITGLVNTRWI